MDIIDIGLNIMMISLAIFIAICVLCLAVIAVAFTIKAICYIFGIKKDDST